MEAVSIITTRSQPVRHYLNPLVLLGTLWRHRDLIRQLTWREIARQYRGSALGGLWSLLVPLAMLTVYTFVFSIVFNARFDEQAAGPPKSGVSRVEFALALYAGLLLFTVFSECVVGAPVMIIENTSYVKRVVFPLEILPIVRLGAALFRAGISICILLAGSLLFLHRVSATLWLFPLAVLALAMLALGVSWFLASVGVYWRDAGQIIGVAINLLFFLTPIFYPLSAIPKDLPIVRLVISVNPLAGIVDSARRTLLWGLPPQWALLVPMLVLSAVAMQLGYTWFMKTKRGFADVL